MKSYRFSIGARSQGVGRFIGHVRSELTNALHEERGASSATVQAIADKLQIPRSAVNRQLAGLQHLTLRSVAELAWALDREIVFEVRRPQTFAGQNDLPDVSTLASPAPLTISATCSPATTLPPARQIRVQPRQMLRKSA
ncbi:XRE family transcriptional regulator [Methylobacterium sp. C25]|uniref:XRE family transcriptional regulator n=1 Tax=Methylobacterium sp. C25 TaxID=2721622 RepID=UPI001F17ACD5|nr:XRE family transcriptional regulator [Methylobacterium sp. C25]MCE4226952.1 XRE family transcriptional regulator [Methylobacterium sp. C25]